MKPEIQVHWLRRRRSVPGGQPLLLVQGLVARVGVRRVLDGFHLELFEGEQVVLTGPNGAGKSTLLHAVAGVGPVLVESGTIELAGSDVTSLPPHQRAALGIALLPQLDHVFPSLTVAENLELALGKEGIEKMHESFPSWAEALPRHRRAGQLSGGEQKKLGWAMTVLRPARLLLLDEPTAGLAEEVALPGDRTAIVVTHDWEGRGGAGRLVVESPGGHQGNRHRYPPSQP